jgi:glucose-1-phosphate thymidylyltransferase
MKGIILAGGTGSRLWPITLIQSKQLLPIFDKPLIFYPLSTLMLSGIKEVLIITTKNSIDSFRSLLSDGSQFGIKIEYEVQDEPNGIAEAFIIGEHFIGQGSVALILGDNIFHGSNLGTQLSRSKFESGAKVFAYKVNNPSQYGVIELDDAGLVKSIEEKPLVPKSNYAIPGLYFFDSNVIDISKKVLPSGRGELEITSVLEKYRIENQLQVTVLDRGTAWLDTGTFESMLSASTYVSIIEERQGSKIACLEEIAWRKNWIDERQLLILASRYKGNDYGSYIENLLID